MLLLTGCTLRGPGAHDPQVVRTLAAAKAAKSGFTWKVEQPGNFFLATASRIEPGAVKVHVYIEGDGFAWATRRRLSHDPTPRDAVALELALRDPNSSVIYVGRPCQFLTAEQLTRCAPRYWSSHRYADDVVTGLDAVVDAALRRSRVDAAARVQLIGYSGGGTLAALLASRRTDINRLVTIAANLDHEAWTRFHDVSPLVGSLSLTNSTRALSEVSQLHLLGEDDEVVPPKLARSFIERVRREAPAAQVLTRVVPGFDHRCCWVANWPSLLESQR